MGDQSFDLLILGGGIVGLWTARQAARAGARVAVVEIGPESLGLQRDAVPSLRFAERENIGATRARNHVLTGNSSYWGGGLVRNSRRALEELFGVDTAAAVEREYPEVERALGVREGFEPEKLLLRDRPLHEVAVLPGKRRGLWSDFREPGVTCFASSTVTGVRFGPQGILERVELRTGAGEALAALARHVSLSMGVIDSNLFAQQWLAPAMPEGVRRLIGTRLHDHWSVPVAALAWRASPSVDPLFPPKFRAGIVAGRRLTLDHGFFHVVVDLDNTPPYDRVKTLLKVRQQGRGAGAILGAAAATMVSPWAMARAGVHYLARRELHIPDGSEVRLVYDFESSRDADNRIVADGASATLHWDLRRADQAHFREVMNANRRWWESLWSEVGIDARWLLDSWTDEDVDRHLSEHAVDAYHMGGGLHPDAYDTAGVSERDGTLRGCPNVVVNGTAFFCRPGPGNPVLTLLARASVFVQNLARS